MRKTAYNSVSAFNLPMLYCDTIQANLEKLQSDSFATPSLSFRAIIFFAHTKHNAGIA